MFLDVGHKKRYRLFFYNFHLLNDYHSSLILIEIQIKYVKGYFLIVENLLSDINFNGIDISSSKN